MNKNNGYTNLITNNRILKLHISDISQNKLTKMNILMWNNGYCQRDFSNVIFRTGKVSFLTLKIDLCEPGFSIKNLANI